MSVETPSSISDIVALAAAQQNPKSLDLCANCSNVSSKAMGFLRCASCKKTAYCSKQCQKQHWKIHKLRCASFMKNPEDANYQMLEKWKNDYKTNLYKIFRGVLVHNGRDNSKTHFAVIVVDYVGDNIEAPFQIVSHKAYADDEPVSELGKISNQIALVRSTNNIPCDEYNQFEIGILHCRGLPGYTGNRNLIKVMPMNSRNMSIHENIPVEMYVALINAGNALIKPPLPPEPAGTIVEDPLVEELKAAALSGSMEALSVRLDLPHGGMAISGSLNNSSIVGSSSLIANSSASNLGSLIGNCNTSSSNTTSSSSSGSNQVNPMVLSCRCCNVCTGSSSSNGNNFRHRGTGVSSEYCE